MKKKNGYNLITEFLVGKETYCVVRTPGGCSVMTEPEYRILWGRLHMLKLNRSGKRQSTDYL